MVAPYQRRLIAALDCCFPGGVRGLFLNGMVRFPHAIAGSISALCLGEKFWESRQFQTPSLGEKFWEVYGRLMAGWKRYRFCANSPPSSRNPGGGHGLSSISINAAHHFLPDWKKLYGTTGQAAVPAIAI
jgi:hypothetical protein